LTNVQSKRTTRAEPEDHLWSADHSLKNAVLVHTRWWTFWVCLHRPSDDGSSRSWPKRLCWPFRLHDPI